MRSDLIFRPSPTIANRSSMPPILRLLMAINEFSVFYNVKPEIFPHLLLPDAKYFHHEILPVLRAREASKDIPKPTSKPILMNFDNYLGTVTFFQKAKKSNYSSKSSCWVDFSYKFPSGDADINKNYHTQRELASYCKYALERQPLTKPNCEFENTKRLVVSIKSCEDVQLRIPVDPIITRFLPYAGQAFLPDYLLKSANREAFELAQDKKPVIKCTQDVSRGLMFRL